MAMLSPVGGAANPELTFGSIVILMFLPPVRGGNQRQVSGWGVEGCPVYCHAALLISHKVKLVCWLKLVKFFFFFQIYCNTA